MVPLSPDERRRLLDVARAAFDAKVRGMPEPDVDDVVVPELRAGAFVSIFRGRDLRGCLGRLTSSAPLSRLVHQLARAVADSDPRFDTVQPGELAGLSLEISVLTPKQAIGSLEEIELGRHGLIVEDGSRSGLLLPQVPAEHGWDRDAFVTNTCLKAGLDGDAWRRGARLFVFDAQVFAETESG